MATSVMARVRCVLDIPVDKWSAEGKMSDLAATVRKEGLNKLEKIARDNGGTVHGQPEVVFVIIEDAR